LSTEPNTLTLHDAARAYLAAGLCVLPARLVEKRPAVASWKPFQERLPTEAELAAWFANEGGPDDAICLVCGHVSGNLEMIDFDAAGELFFKWLDLVEKRLPKWLSRLVIEQSQRGGMHVVYRCVESVCGNMKLAQRRRPDGKIETLIETRGEGGLFLCTPSPGYTFMQGDFTNLPVLTTDERDVLLQAAWELNEYMPPAADAPASPPPAASTSAPPVSASVPTVSSSSSSVSPSLPVSSPPVRGVSLVGHFDEPLPTSPSSRPGDDFNARGDVRALLTRHGWTLAKSGANEYWRRPGKDSGWSATLKDRVFYAFSSNATPFEPNQAYSPFSVYALLEHGGDFALAASALRGLGFGSTPAGGGAVPPSPTSPASPTSAAASASAAVPLFDDIYELVSASPVMRRPVIHGLLREGETMNVISAPKMGKSWLVLDLAMSIATGRDWMGFRCERGDVLILDNELHRETIANRIPRVAAARGLEMSAYAPHVCVRSLRGQLQDLFSLGTLFQSLPAGRFKVIILDAFYRFMPMNMDENDNGTMSSLYNHIDRYADVLGCSFVLIHHSTKGNQSGKAVTDVGAGAGSQSRATDTHLVLRPHEEASTVVFDAAVRSWPPCQPRCLRWEFPIWSPADELDPSQLKSDYGRKRPAQPEKKDEWTLETFANAFVDSEPSTRQTVLSRAASAGLSDYKAERMLRHAEKKGFIIRTGTGKRNQPCLYTRETASPSEGNQP